jgi:hypothetical protein
MSTLYLRQMRSYAINVNPAWEIVVQLERNRAATVAESIITVNSSRYNLRGCGEYDKDVRDSLTHLPEHLRKEIEAQVDVKTRPVSFRVSQLC